MFTFDYSFDYTYITSIGGTITILHLQTFLGSVVCHGGS